MRAGLIVNPRSGKSSGKGLALANKLRHNINVPVKILEHFEQLPVFLNDMASAGVTDLFISSGDGTIQAIQTDLAERQPFAALPRLALLPHGTTNMTAADLGFRHRGIDAQANFMMNATPKDLRERPTVRAANPRDGKARHGMFLGTGAVAEATLYCQQAFNAKGVKGDLATFATLARSVLRSIFTAPDPNNATRFDRPFPIAAMADGRKLSEGTQLLMLVSTLEKLILGTRPFWGGKTGPIRATVLPYPVPSVVRWLLPMMYGGEDRRVPEGAKSTCASLLEVRTPSKWVVDGEFFDGPADAPLRLETGPAFTYVCG
ncbi:MAG: diacylglycerol kinase family protein [Aestuariivirga sp.]